MVSRRPPGDEVRVKVVLNKKPIGEFILGPNAPKRNLDYKTGAYALEGYLEPRLQPRGSQGMLMARLGIKCGSSSRTFEGPVAVW